MDKARINAVIERYLNGNSTEEERLWVEQWLDERSRQSAWDWRDEKHRKEVQAEVFNRISEQAVGVQPLNRLRRMPVYLRAAAAVLLIGLLLGFWFLPGHKADVERSYAGRSVKPGTKAATLQLGNGELIELDDQAAGLLSQSGDVKISKGAGGIIQYHAVQNLSAKIVTNTLSIPRGGQYQLSFSDGTHVWINSETRLIYPSRFAGKERRVKIIGEAYFEVAKNADMPFIVETEGMDIRVKGTEFNVSAYGNAMENMTTLIEGSVAVYRGGKLNMELRPGQQAYQLRGRTEIGKRMVDVEPIVSWKKGYFSFEYLSLEEVMNEISRWYDIDYKIIGKAAKQEKLGGTFSREKSIDELLTYIEQLVDVKIIRKERSVTIMY